MWNMRDTCLLSEVVTTQDHIKKDHWLHSANNTMKQSSGLGNLMLHTRCHNEQSGLGRSVSDCVLKSCGHRQNGNRMTDPEKVWQLQRKCGMASPQQPPWHKESSSIPLALSLPLSSQHYNHSNPFIVDCQNEFVGGTLLLLIVTKRKDKNDHQKRFLLVTSFKMNVPLLGGI